MILEGGYAFKGAGLVTEQSGYARAATPPTWISPLAEGLTVQMLTRPVFGDSSNKYALLSGGNNSETIGFSFVYRNGNFLLLVNDGRRYYQLTTSAGSAPVNMACEVGFILQGTQCRFFVNAVQAGLVSGTAVTATTTAHTDFHANGLLNPYFGESFYLRSWDRALSVEEYALCSGQQFPQERPAIYFQPFEGKWACPISGRTSTLNFAAKIAKL